MGYVVKAPATVGVPVHGTSDLFPVRRIFCVGRNYAAHAREMGHDPDREPPFFFSKPADAIVICADPKNPTRIAYYEVYDSEAAFEAHQQTAHFKKYIETGLQYLANRVRTVYHRVTP